ncbi:MAG: acyltransferase [Ruminiclostridium sp.]|nr:acyltransferase [Ruminiclostridium sp.]
MIKLLKRLNQNFKMKELQKQGLKLGKNTIILTAADNIGSEPFLISIGDNSVVTAGVRFITHDGAIRVFNRKPEYRHIDNKYGKIDIKENCFIGINAIIMPNVTIGPNAVVGAGAVVYKDVRPNTCVAGNPARFTCTIEEYISLSEKTIIPDYGIHKSRKREILADYFWNREDKENTEEPSTGVKEVL